MFFCTSFDFVCEIHTNQPWHLHHPQVDWITLIIGYIPVQSGQDHEAQLYLGGAKASPSGLIPQKGECRTNCWKEINAGYRGKVSKQACSIWGLTCKEFNVVDPASNSPDLNSKKFLPENYFTFHKSCEPHANTLNMCG